MVCINANSAMNPVFQGNGRLCVNVLNHEQEIMARHFAGMTGMTMEERFALSCWQKGRWRSRCSRARWPALKAR
jgi:flavin reductase (NADH)